MALFFIWLFFFKFSHRGCSSLVAEEISTYLDPEQFIPPLPSSQQRLSKRYDLQHRYISLRLYLLENRWGVRG